MSLVSAPLRKKTPLLIFEDCDAIPVLNRIGPSLVVRYVNNRNYARIFKKYAKSPKILVWGPTEVAKGCASIVESGQRTSISLDALELLANQ